jgi:hypothetical protein
MLSFISLMVSLSSNAYVMNAAGGKVSLALFGFVDWTEVVSHVLYHISMSMATRAGLTVFEQMWPMKLVVQGLDHHVCSFAPT